MKKQMIHNYGLQFGSSFPKTLLDIKKRIVVRRRSRCWLKSNRDVVINECGQCPSCMWFVERCDVCRKEESSETKRLWELGTSQRVGNGLVEITYKTQIEKRSARYCARCISKKILPTQIPGKMLDMVLAINNVSIPPAWCRKRFVKSVIFDQKDGGKGENNNLWNCMLQEGDRDAIVIN